MKTHSYFRKLSTCSQRSTAILLFALFSSSVLYGAESPPGRPELKKKFAVGFTYLGGQLKYGFKRPWSAEARALFASADSEAGKVSSNVVGIRGYRHFFAEKKLQLYSGLETGYIFSKLNDSASGFNGSSLSISGYTVGGFGGVEYYVHSRVSLGFDIGPYYLRLNEKETSSADSGLDFIFNSFINFYIF